MRTDPNAETKPLAVAGVPDDGKGGRPGLFLDRDGVLLQPAEGKYINSWRKARLIDGTLEALAELAKLDAYIFIVTNQAGVAAGHLTPGHLGIIHELMCKQIEISGGRIDAIYSCTHAKDAGCDCRKPEPGMILRLAKRFDVDLSRSVMVGDYITDFAAARNAGIPRYIHVRTGRQSVIERIQSGGTIGTTHDDLWDAVPVIGKIVNERVS